MTRGTKYKRKSACGSRANTNYFFATSSFKYPENHKNSLGPWEFVFSSTLSSKFRILSPPWQTTIYRGILLPPMPSFCLPVRLDQSISISKFPINPASFLLEIKIKVYCYVSRYCKQVFWLFSLLSIFCLSIYFLLIAHKLWLKY